jgi:hypothetical protein
MDDYRQFRNKYSTYARIIYSQGNQYSYSTSATQNWILRRRKTQGTVYVVSRFTLLLQLLNFIKRYIPQLTN